MDRPPTPDYSMLIEHQEHVKGAAPAIDPPVRALVTAKTYGGDVVAIEADLVRRSGTWLCIQQSADGWPVWFAWVHSECCEPVR